MGGQGLDVPGGRRAHTQRCLLSSGENQAPGISPPEHTIVGVAAGSTEHREREQHHVAHKFHSPGFSRKWRPCFINE